MNSKKVKTKNEAIQILQELQEFLNEIDFFSSNIERSFVNLSRYKIATIKNSINHSDDFYNDFFFNKTKEEIKQWINEESKKW